MATTWNSIKNFQGAGFSSDGSTGIAGATRARVGADFTEPKRQRGGADLMPQKVICNGVNRIRIQVETEAWSEVIRLMPQVGATGTQWILAVNYYDMAATARKTLYQFARLVSFGDSEFPPAEQGGQAPRYQLEFELEQGSGVTDVTTAIVDSTGFKTLT